MKKRLGIFVFLLCFCLCLTPCKGRAASTTQATAPISPAQKGSLTLFYGYQDTVFADLPVTVYQIAQVSDDFQYTLTPSFASSNLTLNGIQTAGEWNVIRSTLESYLFANSVEPSAVGTTDQNGRISVSSLETGLYLVTVAAEIPAESNCFFDSSLISLPSLSADGTWSYQVTASAKAQFLPPVNPDETVEWSVLKLWKGDEGASSRPDSIEVEIFRNGERYETVVLSEENQWSYGWSAPDDGSRWTVTERNVPTGYTVTVEQRGESFVLTNTLQTAPEKPPQTSDVGNLWLYILLLAASGFGMMVLGTVGRRVL